jgi:hypothetical protein
MRRGLCQEGVVAIVEEGDCVGKCTGGSPIRRDMGHRRHRGGNSSYVRAACWWVDRVAAISQQRESALANVISRNYSTGIDCALRKETLLPIIVGVRCLQLEEDGAAIVVARTAGRNLKLLVLRR